MADKDYYKILGVDKNVDAKELKKAFYKKAHTCHPDKAKGEEQRKEFEAKFKKLNEAYQVLSDPQKRSRYDQFGAAGVNGAAGQGGFNWQDMGGFGGQGAHGFGGVDFDLGDIFENFFGGGMGGGRRRSRKGVDIKVQVDITLEEAVRGVEKEISISRQKTCSHCKGEGAEPGTKVKTCATCKGSGKVMGVQNTIFGQVQTTQVCPSCAGKGKTYDKKCTVCSGTTKEMVNENIKVNIPAGISVGEMIKMADRGEVSVEGGKYGDLYIVVNVKKHSDFDRQGDDIYSEVEITMTQAILGDKIKVKTIDSEVKLKIPEGTHSGDKFRLKGKGVPHLNSMGKGDHYVIIKLKIPKDLNRKQKKLLEEFENSLEEKNY